MKLLSVTQTATRLRISRRRVLALIAEKRLPAEWVGSRWVLKARDVENYQPLPTGRPKSDGK